jgi:hypothetical protein
MRKVKEFIQENPEKSALVLAIILVLPMFLWGLSIIKLPEELTFDSVFKLITAIIFQLLTFACVGGLFWFIFVTSFGEKKRKELSDRALKSGLEVMINQALIENGSITKPEQMVKL